MTLTSGNKKKDHLVLTVGDLPGQALDLGPVLSGMNIKVTHVNTGQDGINALDKKESDKNESVFSLVICDQRLTDMKGTALLARAKESSPETIRFLITGESDMDTITSAINKGLIHQYISPSWTGDQISEAIRSELTRYEHHRDSDSLLTLAQTQNKELFELNCQLMETGKQLDKKSKALAKDIAAIQAQLKALTVGHPLPLEKLGALIFEEIKNSDTDKAEHLNTLYTQTILSLYGTFNDLALRNGLELPEPKSEPGESNA